MEYEKIKPYIEQGLVSEGVHPEDANVRIFNYTQKCQFSQAWDDVTRQCRGLILNVATGEVIARPFPKFFNYGEHVSKGWAIPTTTPEVYEKLDGSLGILYELNGKEWIATRGSFVSDQAKWATNWWRENIPAGRIEQGVTELFEIIYPENRIVVSYDFSGLVHLTTIETATGKTLKRHWPAPIRSARAHATRPIEELVADTEHPNEEGFVLFYPEENVRMKIKFAEYVRLHKLVTGVNEIAIWEHVSAGKEISTLIENVPDEFMNWVKDVHGRLVRAYNVIVGEAEADYRRIIDGEDELFIRSRGEYRKDFAIKAQACKYPGILFAKLDEKPIAPIIWKMVRPHGQSSFKIDIDQ